MSILRRTLTLAIELTSAVECFDFEGIDQYSGKPVRLHVRELRVEQQAGHLTIQLTGIKYRADGILGKTATISTVHDNEARAAMAYMPDQLRLDLVAAGIRVPGLS